MRRLITITKDQATPQGQQSLPTISMPKNSEASSSEEYTSEEENSTPEPTPQQTAEEDLELYTAHTDLGEEDPIVDLTQHFDQSLHLEDQPQSSPFDYHQPLPPLPMSNQPVAAT